MSDAVPFLSPVKFEAMFRPLSDGEATLAALLLRAAAIWIRARVAEAGRAALAVDDPMALLVSFEVVRDAMPPMPDKAGITQYSIQTDDRLESGTIAAAAGILDFNERHYKLLGLSFTAGPHYGGMGGDFGDITRGRGQRVDEFGNAIELVVVGERP